MKLIKMIGLTAVAAVVAMAFLGASSAMATSTQLCKVHTEPCPAGSGAAKVHMTNVGDVVLHATLLGINVLILCHKSLGEGTLLGLAAPQVGHLTSLNFEECFREKNGVDGDKCTVTVTSLGLLEVLKTALNLGEAKTTGTNALVSCPGLPECEYGGNEVALGSVEGALHKAGTGHGMLNANATLKVKGGAFCPSTALWLGLYEPLEHLFVVA